MQALTRGVRYGETLIDRLDDRPEAPGFEFRLRPPTFPTCGVSPDPVPRGGSATVEVSGLLPDSDVHVFFGPDDAGLGLSDAHGDASIPFEISCSTRDGNHLVTVGVVGTGLTADCIVEVEPNLACDDDEGDDEGDDSES